MKFVFDNTLQDLVAFAKHYYRSSHAMSRMRSKMFRFIVGIVVAGALVAAFQEESVRPLVFAGIFIAVYSVFHLLISPRLEDSMVTAQARGMFGDGENKALYGPREIEITDDAVTERSKYHEHTTRWAAVEKIIETPTHAFIYWCAASAYAIPRASVSDETYRMFLNAAKSAWEAAKSRPEQ